MEIINDILLVCGIILLLLGLWSLFDTIIFPRIIQKGMTEIERNPNWVTSRLQYFGLVDIDYVLCKSKWGMLPRFRVKDHKKLEVWLDNDTKIDDVEIIGKLVLATRIKMDYGVTVYGDKPLYWLSILYYLLNGGDVDMKEIKWEEKKQKTC